MLRVHAVLGNSQWLDGGAMFGNAPRAVWERWCPPDERGRIELACRAMLVDEGDRKLLFETGVGAFFEPELRERYGVRESEHVLLRSLEALDVAHTDVDVVVLSHLHFDHAGGLLPAWSGDEAAPGELLFPNACYVVGADALARARAPHPRDRASFVEGLADRLEATGRLHVASPGGGDPVLGARYGLQQSDGHTPGLLLTTVRGARASILYASDLAPGAPWVHLPITMGYDRYPERLIDEKAACFERALAEGTRIFFTHDPRSAHASLARDARGRYSTSDARPDTGAGLELD